MVLQRGKTMQPLYSIEVKVVRDFCRDKHVFVVTGILLRDKTSFVATEDVLVLSDRTIHP